MGISESAVYTKELVTPLGQMLGAANDKGLFFLGFSENLSLGYNLRKSMKLIGGFFGKKRKSGAADILNTLQKELKEYFDQKRTVFTIPLVIEGTVFQKNVWNKLTSIPYGKKWSYSQLAENTGNPLAVRAVGSANSRNRIPILIPCHRVILKNGSEGGYSGGIWRKRFLLEMEASTLKKPSPKLDFYTK